MRALAPELCRPFLVGTPRLQRSGRRARVTLCERERAGMARLSGAFVSLLSVSSLTRPMAVVLSFSSLVFSSLSLSHSLPF